MTGPNEYRVLLRGLKDQSEAGRQEFLRRFGEAYKMSTDQAAQWLRSRKGVVYTVKTPEAAEKAVRYLEGMGGVATVEKTEVGPEPPAPPEVPAVPASAVETLPAMVSGAMLLSSSAASPPPAVPAAGVGAVD